MESEGAVTLFRSGRTSKIGLGPFTPASRTFGGGASIRDRVISWREAINVRARGRGQSRREI